MIWHISKFQNRVNVKYLFTESTGILLSLLSSRYGKQKQNKKNLSMFLSILTSSIYDSKS